MKGSAKLTKEQRRQMALEALTNPDRPAVTRRYGVAKETLYKALRDAEKDPEGALEEARREVAYRERVIKILSSEREGFPPRPGPRPRAEGGDGGPL